MQNDDSPLLLSIAGDSLMEAHEYIFSLPTEVTGRSDIYIFIEQSLNVGAKEKEVPMEVWMQPGIMAEARVRLGLVNIPRTVIQEQGVQGIVDEINKDDKLRRRMSLIFRGIKDFQSKRFHHGKK